MIDLGEFHKQAQGFLKGHEQELLDGARKWMDRVHWAYEEDAVIMIGLVTALNQGQGPESISLSGYLRGWQQAMILALKHPEYLMGMARALQSTYDLQDEIKVSKGYPAVPSMLDTVAEGLVEHYPWTEASDARDTQPIQETATD